MSYAHIVQQFHKALLPKRKRQSRATFLGKPNVTEISLKKSTGADMAWVRKKIALQKKKNRQNVIIAFALTFLVALFVGLLIKSQL